MTTKDSAVEVMTAGMRNQDGSYTVGEVAEMAYDALIDAGYVIRRASDERVVTLWCPHCQEASGFHDQSCIVVKQKLPEWSVPLYRHLDSEDAG